MVRNGQYQLKKRPQTLLTNKKQGNSTKDTANIIKPTKTRINREKYIFGVMAS